MSALEGMCLILAMILGVSALGLVRHRAGVVCIVGSMVFMLIAVGSLVWRLTHG